MSVKKLYSCLVGKNIKCKPKAIYFGTDGRAYTCERGLRSKDERFYAGFTLTEGDTEVKYKECVVEEDCLSCLKTEQEFKIV